MFGLSIFLEPILNFGIIYMVTPTSSSTFHFTRSTIAKPAAPEPPTKSPTLSTPTPKNPKDKRDSIENKANESLVVRTPSPEPYSSPELAIENQNQNQIPLLETPIILKNKNINMPNAQEQNLQNQLAEEQFQAEVERRNQEQIQLGPIPAMHGRRNDTLGNRVHSSKLKAFDGKNPRQFLDKYELYQTGTPDVDKINGLALHVRSDFYNRIRGMATLCQGDWEVMKKKVLGSFMDETLHQYSLDSLNRLIRKTREAGKPSSLEGITKYYFKFTEISQYLIQNQVLESNEEGRLFLSVIATRILKEIYQENDAERKRDVKDEQDNFGGTANNIHVEKAMTYIKRIFAVNAGRGRASKISRKTRKNQESDSEGSEDYQSDSGSDSDDSASESDSEDEKRSYKFKSKNKRSHSKSAKASKREENKQKKTKQTGETGLEELMAMFNNKFEQINVRFDQASTQNNRYNVPYQQKKPVYQQPSQNNWIKQPPIAASADYYNDYEPQSNYVSAPQPGPAYPPGIPRTPASGTNLTPLGAPKIPQTCRWCLEPGHWLSSCVDLGEALAAGVVNRDSQGKIRYKDGTFLSSTYPGGMKKWTQDAEATGRPPGATYAKPPFQRDAPPHVNFAPRPAQIPNASSLRYEPPSISEGGRMYDVETIRLAEDSPTPEKAQKFFTYECDNVKRARSNTSNESTNKRNDTRPRESLLETKKGKEKEYLEPAPHRTDASTSKLDVENDNESERPARRARMQTKMEAPIENRGDAEALLETILSSTVSVELGLLLANSEGLARLLEGEIRRKRVPINGTNNVGISIKEEISELKTDLAGFEAEKVRYVGSLAVAQGSINDFGTSFLLDGGSQISIMNDRLRRTLGLSIRVDGEHKVRTANGEINQLLGISEDVAVTIGGITTLVPFFIATATTNDILLGQPFLRAIQAKFDYHEDGSVLMSMRHFNKEVMVEVTPKHSGVLSIPPRLHRTERAQNNEFSNQRGPPLRASHSNYEAAEEGEIFNISSNQYSLKDSRQRN